MIGNTIREIRQRKGYSISKLAKMADVSKSYLSEIERGIQMNPSLKFIQKITAALDISHENLLQGAKSDNGRTVELDEEWIALLKEAITNGLKKDNFRKCRNCRNCLFICFFYSSL